MCSNSPPPVASAAGYSKVMVLLLFYCLLLFSFCCFVLFGLCFVMQHIVSFLVSQSFRQGRESWLFYLNCLRIVMWLLVICVTFIKHLPGPSDVNQNGLCSRCLTSLLGMTNVDAGTTMFEPNIIFYYIPITDTTLGLSVFWLPDTESRINELRFSESISLSFKTRLTSVTCFCDDVM